MFRNDIIVDQYKSSNYDEVGLRPHTHATLEKTTSSSTSTSTSTSTSISNQQWYQHQHQHEHDLVDVDTTKATASANLTSFHWVGIFNLQGHIIHV